MVKSQPWKAGRGWGPEVDIPEQERLIGPGSRHQSMALGPKSALGELGHFLPTLTGSLWLRALTFGVGEAPESRGRLQL